MAVAVCVAAVFAYRTWNSDERQILRMLDTVAATVSHEQPAAGVAALAAVAGLTTYLAPDVVIEPGAPAMSLRGAQDVVSTAARLRVGVPMLRLAFEHTQVPAVTGNTARVYATAVVTTRAQDGQDVADARGLIIDVRRADGQWVITVARAVPAAGPEP
jgi:ketosteroid isomerase-like protein